MGKGGGSALGSVGNVSSGLISGGPQGAFGAYQSEQGAKKSARAAQNAALAQQAEAQRQYDLNSSLLGGASDKLDQATVSSLSSLDRDIANQSRNLARQEQLIAQIDPTIMEASQQALKLLRGEESASLAPLKNQRNQQRQKLLASLREQLGPGAESSTAGIQALNRFDSESANIFGAGQQQALGNLGNISSQFTAQRPDMLREIMGQSGFGQQKYNLGLNQANFGLQRANAMQGIGAGVLNSAGANQVGNLMMGQYGQQMGNRNYEAGVQQQNQMMEMGSKAAGSMAMSDRRMKTDITVLPVSHYREVPTYLFRYKDERFGDDPHIGVMAQDLLAINPNHPAVIMGRDGYYRVDYSQLEEAE